jgi:photosynthetic reaction center H subunit
MEIGAITKYIDVAQLVLYAFWIFFAGLIIYLRREDKREGYPLESERSDFVTVQGFPPVPSPKVFRLRNGGTYAAPPGNIDKRQIRATPVAAWPGAPLQPSGDPMVDGVGPGSYVEREDVPDLTAEGEIKMVPLRAAPDFFVEPRDPDPRAMSVITYDGEIAGTVRDVWIDKAEPQIRYLEVEVAGSPARRVLLPMNFARIDGRRREVKVASVRARHFANAPTLQNPEQVTLREEDRLCAFFASGHLYAEPKRLGPLV